MYLLTYVCTVFILEDFQDLNFQLTHSKFKPKRCWEHTILKYKLLQKLEQSKNVNTK